MLTTFDKIPIDSNWDVNEINFNISFISEIFSIHTNNSIFIPLCSNIFPPQYYQTDSAIRKAIQTNGPIQTGIDSDFMNYKSGIYVYKSGYLLGGHSILLVRWGYDKAILIYYLIAQNSWGKDCDENVYFRIAFGECGIEDLLIYLI